MLALSAFALATLVLALAPAVALHAQQPGILQLAPDASVDNTGDTLPAVALARLGHLRLRHAGDVLALRFDAESGQVISSDGAAPDQHWSCVDGAPLAAGPAVADGFSALRDRPGLELRVAPAGNVALSWSLADGRLQLHRPDYEAPAQALSLDGRLPQDACFSPDGARVLIVGARITDRNDFGTWLTCLSSDDGTLLWEADLPGMTPSAVLAAPPVGSLGASAIVTGKDGRAQRLQFENGSNLGLWQAHESHITAATADSAGGLVTASAGGELACWTLTDASHELPARLDWRRAGHLMQVSCVASSPELGLVASGGRDHRVLLWSRKDGEPRAVLPSHAARLTDALRSADGIRTVSAGWDGLMGLWSADGGHRAWVDAHEGRIAGLALLGEHEELLLSCGQDGWLRLWHADDGEPVGAGVQAGVALLSLAATSDGRHVACGGGDGRVHLWTLVRDAAGVPDLMSLGAFPSGGHAAQALAYTPDGSALAVGSSHIRMLEAPGGSVRWEVAAGAPVSALCLSADGTVLAAALASRTVLLLDARDGSERLRWSDHPGRVTAVALAPDGQRVAAGGGTAQIRVLDLRSSQVSLLAGHIEELTSLRWSADGVLISAAADGTALLWSMSAAR